MKITKVIKKIVNNKINKSQEHMCNMCDLKGKTQVTLNKHTHTKHNVNESNSKGTEKAIKCVLCEEKFNSVNGFQEHISEHLGEIEDIYIENLKNEEDMFECDMCSFESGNENSVRDHLVEHVKIPKVRENVKSEIKKKNSAYGRQRIS